jgi:hypothetical protein
VEPARSTASSPFAASDRERAFAHADQPVTRYAELLHRRGTLLLTTIQVRADVDSRPR